MAFYEGRMADQLSYGFQAVPTYSTRIVVLDNGREQRNASWSRAKRRYTAEHTALSEAQFAALLAIFHACKGSAHGFRFKDWTDYRCTNESLGTAPGSGTAAVQLTKTYTAGSLSTVRNITKPLASSIVYEGGIAKAGTLNTTTGLFAPTSAWAGGALTWTGEFDVPVRFASDEMPSTYEAYKNILRSDIELVEDFL